MFVKMREQVFLLCVITLLTSASSRKITIRNCDDCTVATSCQAVAIILSKYDSATYEKLGEAFCGLDNHSEPKMCCSLLSNAELTTPGPGVDSIEHHPNLQLLPETCGDILWTKLLGGFTIELNEYPWLALISYRTRTRGKFQCSGSLINERYVLTAAHCISNQMIVGVRIGEFNLETDTDCQGWEPSLTCNAPVQDLLIEEAIVHPAYQRIPSLNNDIGLLRLKKPANLTFENAKTICLPVTKELQDRNVSGLHSVIAGWGLSETGSMSSTLQATAVPIYTQDHCSAELNRSLRDGIDFHKKLCVGDNGRSELTGDHGGPLMVAGPYNGTDRFIQYGIYSFRQTGSNVTTVYTDVSKYMKWILDTIKP